MGIAVENGISSGNGISPFNGITGFNGISAGGTGGGPTPPPFSPADIANLFFWYDPSDVATITATGNSVDQINDKSGNAYNATGSGTSRPTTGTRTINGLNVLDFDGTNDVLTLPSGTYPLNNGNNTVFAVFASDDTVTLARLLNSLQGGTSTRLRIVFAPGSNALQCINNIGTGVFSSRTLTPDTSQHVAMMNRSGTSVTAYYDGLAGTPAAAVSAADTDVFLMGAGPGPSNPFNGVMGDVIAYSRSLSNAEMNQVGVYLGTKWAFSWNNL